MKLETNTDVNIKLEKMWKSVITETHKIKPNKKNLLEREKLFTLQILLEQYELAKNENNTKLAEFYTDVLENYKN